MSRLTQLMALGAVAATLAAGACSESTAPPAVDPTAMATAVTTLNTSLAQNQVFQSLAALDGTAALGAPVARAIAAAQPLRAATRPPGSVWTAEAARTRTELEAMARAPAAVTALFFSNVLGKTFQWDTTRPAGYRILDSTLAGAPSNGVRFILYQTDTTGQPSLPLLQTGYLDLSDISNASVNEVHLLLHVGSQKAADYTITEQKTTASLSLTAAGYVVNVVGGGSRVNFTLSHVLALSDSSLSTSYQANDGATAVSLVSQVSGTGATAVLTLDWSATNGGTVEIVGTNSVPAVNLAFKFNGATIATATGSQANATITPLTAPLAQLATILTQLDDVYVNLSLLFAPGLLVFG